jgi:hypothetical protein
VSKSSHTTRTARLECELRGFPIARHGPQALLPIHGHQAGVLVVLGLLEDDGLHTSTVPLSIFSKAVISARVTSQASFVRESTNYKSQCITYFFAVSPINRGCAGSLSKALILPLRVDRNRTCLPADGEGVRSRGQQAKRSSRNNTFHPDAALDC